jgi:hypothetical protein
MEYLLYIVVVIVLLGGQHLLSTRENPLLGGILPLCVIPFSIWVIISRSLSLGFKTLFPFAGLLIILLSVWAEGREHLHKKQKKELEKMRAKDINE